MADIVKSWMQRLGTQTDVALADLLGVTTMTIYRWKTNDVKPDMTALVRYDRIVESLAAGALKAARRAR